LRESEERIINEVDRAAQEALASFRDRMPVPESAAEGVYADGAGSASSPAPGVEVKQEW